MRFDSRGTTPSFDDHLAHTESQWVMGDAESDYDWNPSDVIDTDHLTSSDLNAHNGDNLPWWEDTDIMTNGDLDGHTRTEWCDDDCVRMWPDETDTNDKPVKTLKQLEREVTIRLVLFGAVCYALGALVMFVFSNV